MQTSTSAPVRPARVAVRQEGFTLVEILLALLILSVGLMGVLALFPLGIDAARISVEATRAATISRMAKAALLTENDTSGSPFDRILADVRRTMGPYFGPWHLPYHDEVYDPGLDGDSTNNGPAVVSAAVAGGGPSLAEYSWSVAVVYPSGLPGHYTWPGMEQSPNMFVVQVTVYRNYRVTTGTADVAPDSYVLADVTGAQQIRNGDYVRYLDASNLGTCDGFWYRVDEIGEVGGSRTIKLSQQYRGYVDGLPEDDDADVQFSDKVIGTYTFYMSAY